LKRISFINPNLLENLTSKQKKLWDKGKFVILPVVHSVRKATIEEIGNHKPLENPNFIGIVWK